MTTSARAPKKAKAKTGKPFHWFHGASVRQLYDVLGEYGPDTVRLEVHTDGKKMTFRVKRTTGPTGVGGEPPPINDSHVCPPQCPPK